MPITVEILKALIEDELASVWDARVTAHIRSMLVEPYVALCQWDYGEQGQQYPWIGDCDSALRRRQAHATAGHQAG
jgi:hypothetical protein